MPQEMFNLSKIPAQDTAIILVEGKNLQEIAYNVKTRQAMHNANCYHKFSVQNSGNYPRDFILGAITKFVLPNELIPVGCHENGRSVFFFAKSCGGAIEKLCQNNLIVPNPENPKLAFKLKITIQYTQAVILVPHVKEINKNLTATLNRSFDVVDRILNLSAFPKKKGLMEYTPLFVPRILSHVLNMSRSLPQIRVINLSHNQLTKLNSLEVLKGSSLMCLNLGHNEIQSLDDLEPLKNLRLREVILDGNPFCGKCDEISYLQRIRQLIPLVERLDGVVVGSGPFPLYKKNFLCDYNGYDLVDIFVQRFFNLYDSNSRHLLEDLYHKNAMFSLTAAYISGQSTSVAAQIKDYKLHSRNLMCLADYSKSNQFLFRGSANIMKMFMKLPPTEHDLCSFNTDLIYYTDTCAMLVIHGVFREPPKTLLDPERLLGFTRSFVLEYIGGEYCIVNEQLHTYNALTCQKICSFKSSKPDNSIPLPQTHYQKQQLIEAVGVITTLTPEWSKKVLEECGYDLKKTLNLFVELYKVDKIPPDAFLDSGVGPDQTQVLIDISSDSENEEPCGTNVTTTSTLLNRQDFEVGQSKQNDKETEFLIISSDSGFEDSMYKGINTTNDSLSTSRNTLRLNSNFEVDELVNTAPTTAVLPPTPGHTIKFDSHMKQLDKSNAGTGYPTIISSEFEEQGDKHASDSYPLTTSGSTNLNTGSSQHDQPNAGIDFLTKISSNSDFEEPGGKYTDNINFGVSSGSTSRLNSDLRKPNKRDIERDFINNISSDSETGELTNVGANIGSSSASGNSKLNIEIEKPNQINIGSKLVMDIESHSKIEKPSKATANTSPTTLGSIEHSAISSAFEIRPLSTSDSLYSQDGVNLCLTQSKNQKKRKYPLKRRPKNYQTRSRPLDRCYFNISLSSLPNK